MERERLIAELEASIADPSQGLPEEVFLFVSRITPLVNVDLLIRDGDGRTLLTWRDDGLYPPGWHVPGGIVRYKESLADRIHAVAKSELGAPVRFRPEPVALNEVWDASRRTRGHFLSLLYDCELLAPPHEARRHDGGTPRHGAWAWHRGCPADLLEVQSMYRKYL